MWTSSPRRGPQHAIREQLRPCIQCGTCTGSCPNAFAMCYAVFDDPERPTSMEPLIEAAAEVFPWKMGARCCGASHMNTKPDVGLTLVSSILKDAQGADAADAIVTVCPMCQMNLEAYQKQAGEKSGAAFKATVLYLPQLLGMAMGLSGADVGLELNLAVLSGFREGCRASA